MVENGIILILKDGEDLDGGRQEMEHGITLKPGWRLWKTIGCNDKNIWYYLNNDTLWQ